MKITNLLAVKNYEAGRDGNLLVAIDEELVAKAYRINDKVMNVRPLICTAYVRNPDDQKRLAKHTDGSTKVDRVIVVSKKFQALFNKTQLILLERQNAMEDVENPDSDVEVRVYADVAAMAKFGVFRSKMAFHKADGLIEKDEIKIGKKLHKDEKKRARQLKRDQKKNKGKGLGNILENEDDDWQDEFFDDEPETTTTTEQPHEEPKQEKRESTSTTTEPEGAPA